MRRVIRLTERDLTRLVKRVIKEEGLKDQPENIKDFQDFMDLFYPGWYKGGKLRRGSGYGTFGPSTQKAYTKHNEEYRGITIMDRSMFEDMDEKESQKWYQNHIEWKKK
jgi:hypothetical protein